MSYYTEETELDFPHRLSIYLGAAIVILAIIGSIAYLIGAPQQKYYTYEPNGGSYKKASEVHVYELKGIYNTIKGRSFRVDYLNGHNKVIKSKYYADESEINKKDLGIPMHSEWEPEDVDFISDNT